jgi:CxxC motif-containing protein (DUF1111 family)
MQKKLKFNLNFISIFNKSLVAIFAIGLLFVNLYGQNFSNNKDKSLLLKPAKKLNDEDYDKLILGRSFFTIPWVEAPSATTARDGLGPLFNANTCVSCHPRNGRGTLYNKNNSLSRALVVRASISSNKSIEHESFKAKIGFVPEPTYGAQISINGTREVAFEAKPKITYEELEVKFFDGEIVKLLKPKYSLENLNYGKLHQKAILSFRIAPTLHGLGLIEQIDNKDILNNVDDQDKNGDGISGRANFVYSNLTKKEELGKYTWKASSPTIIEQVAAAAHNDMGLTSPLIEVENCTSSQKACNEAPKARDNIDITQKRLEAMSFYIKNLKAYRPKETKEFKEGLEVFKAISCNKCHISSFKTKAGFDISPYSDFLLHDMGEGLADGRVEFKASASEWRTAPLWGLALHEKINAKKPRLLHDGRARTYQEAILWHGGEALASKEAYMKLEKKQRQKLIEFLKGL